MSSWDDYKLTCIHGVTEGIDSHDCQKCLEMAIAEGKDTSKGQTYIYCSEKKNESSNQKT